MADPHPLTEWELERITELQLLEPGEVIVEHEAAMVGRSVGAMVVTDRRLMFVSTTLVRKRTKVLSIALADITAANAPPVWFMKDRAEITLETNGQHGAPHTVLFKQIPGGVERATEIVDSIVRERASSQRGSSSFGG